MLDSHQKSLTDKLLSLTEEQPSVRVGREHLCADLDEMTLLEQRMTNVAGKW